MHFADVVTTTTYKNLRGPRGGIVLSSREDLSATLDRAVFPGVQGSVLLTAVAAKAVCLRQAAQTDFRRYAHALQANAPALAAALIGSGLQSRGWHGHPLVIVDLRSLNLTGADASVELEGAGITVNKNLMAGDAGSPQMTSGLRLGTSAGTARGLDTKAFELLGGWIAEVLQSMVAGDLAATRASVRSRVNELVAAHPIYPR